MGGEKNGHRGRTKEGHSLLPAEDVKKRLGNHHNTTKKTKLRQSVTPGTVLIMLAGRFKGQRVVFLKQLDGGLLLITGPYEVNGVPLRRVPQSYVIATQTKIDISGVKSDSVDDALFKKTKTKKKKKILSELEWPTMLNPKTELDNSTV